MVRGQATAGFALVGGEGDTETESSSHLTVFEMLPLAVTIESEWMAAWIGWNGARQVCTSPEVRRGRIQEAFLLAGRKPEHVRH